MKTFLLLLACSTLVACDRSQVATDSLKFTAMDGSEFDLAKLKGKFVLVDFWASWCGPCMAEADHMVRIKNQYRDKLQLVGISLDTDRASAAMVIRSKGFAWPQYFDGKGWSTPLAQKWGVDSIPRTFLIDTEGKVVWSGHPAQLDAQLEKLVK